MDNDDLDTVAAGCLIGCALVVGAIFLSWLGTVAVIWLICFLLSPFGIIFDLGMATAVWLALKLISFFIKSNK